jgi:two-component system cell cycle sensor histidine kinase/response regulator CckA
MSMAFDTHTRGRREDLLEVTNTGIDLHRSATAVAHDVGGILESAALPLSRVLAEARTMGRFATELAAVVQAIRSSVAVLAELDGGDAESGSDIASTLRRCRRVLEPALPIAHRIEAKGLQDAPRVALGEGDLFRLLHNLMLNASEAGPRDGTITVSAVAVDSMPHVERKAPRPCVRLTVADTGRGITRLEFARAFWTSTCVSTDVPLRGLPIAFAIVRAAGGRIDVQAARDRGTRIHCYLPRAEAVACR